MNVLGLPPVGYPLVDRQASRKSSLLSTNIETSYEMNFHPIRLPCHLESLVQSHKATAAVRMTTAVQNQNSGAEGRTGRVTSMSGVSRTTSGQSSLTDADHIVKFLYPPLQTNAKTIPRNLPSAVFYGGLCVCVVLLSGITRPGPGWTFPAGF